MEKKYISREESKQIMINILNCIDDICKENGINYFLTAGTLLGAARHKGFIPWDDDIDVILLYEDYEILINLLKKQTKYPWLSIVDMDVDGYYYPFAKAVDNRTVAKQEDNLTPHGIWVDIFPLCNFPNAEKERVTYMKRCRMLRALELSMVTDFKNIQWTKKAVIKLLFKGISLFWGKKNIANKMFSYSRKYNNIDTKYVGSIYTRYDKEYIEREKMLPPATLEFEGKMYPVPACWDEYLRNMYGDYMQLPPENKRTTHSITAWWIN